LTEVYTPIDALIKLEKIKVWSLIVTLFGDLEQAGSQVLSGKQINNLLSHIGIKPEATRVALHRLKNENWIVTSKSGRETFYQMSEKAKQETSSVYSDVYGAQIKYPEGWRLVVLPDFENVEISCSVSVMKNILLVPKVHQNVNKEVIQTEIKTENIPAWFADKIIKPSTLEIASKLKIAAEMPTSKMTRYNQFVMRLLILHYWRKLALRDSVWCYISLMEDSALAHCQKSVSNFLKNTQNINPSLLTD